MAKATFLLQAITENNHSNLLKSLLSKELEQILVSVAFARTQGVNVIAESLKLNSKNAKVIVGIRNDMTSFQAIEMLLDTGATIYTVDTGSKNTIFHPKIYLTKLNKNVEVVVGSANLTFNGLHNNIEGSSILSLNLDNAEDLEFFNDVTTHFDSIIKNYPEHVTQINDKEIIKKMFLDGRLADETIAITSSTSAKKEGTESVPQMKLHKVFPVSTVKKKKDKVFVDEILTIKDGQEFVIESAPGVSPSADEFYLVWQSNELKERDLNIPTGKNTNPTGSMGWKKGASEHIDHRHHFRDEVFADVVWNQDPKLPHYERAQVKFYIETKGEYQGEFTLKVSHNNDTASETYLQKNSMTSVSWGAAKEVIAKEDLLGRILYLYRKDSNPPEFIMAID